MLDTTDVINKISEALRIPQKNILNITASKKGMTNRSFLFTYNNQKYIARIPGEGTEQLLNRNQEYNTYQILKNTQICDDILYFSPETGFKITRFILDTHTCDAHNPKEVEKCMHFLRKFHDKNLKTDYTFDLFKQIEFYESLRNGIPSRYSNYNETKRKIYELKTYIDCQPKHWTLAHIDAVPDNFLFYNDLNNTEQIRLIDWEYAGMQDAHIDIAMFAIYSYYDFNPVNELIHAYFHEGCPHSVKLKIYCYIAICGLLWSNWCEFKHLNGVEFGEYALRQYQYAEEYYDIFKSYH